MIGSSAYVLTDVGGSIAITAPPGPSAAANAPPAGGSGTPPPPQTFLWSFASPTNRDQFLRVGHCLFALLAALTGAGIARWFQRSGPT